MAIRSRFQRAVRTESECLGSRFVNSGGGSGQECGVVMNGGVWHEAAPLVATRRSVEQMFSDHAQAVFAFAARRLGDAAGRDVVAETFRIALEADASFDPALGSERGWLFGIATNLVRRHWRTEQRRMRTAIRASSNRPPTVDPLVEVENRIDATRDVARLLQLMEELGAPDRDALLMFAWDGLSYLEIAQALAIPVGTVRSRIHRARQMLRDRISGGVR